MPQTIALENTAKLLPLEECERFLIIANRLRNVPDDDEYLFILEATGYLTKFMSVIPGELRELVDEARRDLSDAHRPNISKRKSPQC